MSGGIFSTETILLLFERGHGTMEGRIFSLQGQKRYISYTGQERERQDVKEIFDGGSVQ